MVRIVLHVMRWCGGCNLIYLLPVGTQLELNGLSIVQDYVDDLMESRASVSIT